MTIDTPKPASNRSVILLVIVAALGYFVDLYDLVLFGVVRIPSLKSLGLEGDELTNVGLHLLNWQMAGMLVGGFAWGVLGDKRGRLSVLYGSILTYSLANLANAFVHDVETYALLRFIAGFGLAGELGAGITIVMESMPAKSRGWGTTVIATFGVLGGATAAAVTDHVGAGFKAGANFIDGIAGSQLAASAIANDSWRGSYVVGGLLGLLLLAARFSLSESEIFKQVRGQNHPRGSLIMLFSNLNRLKRLGSVVAVGLPIWFVAGILVPFCPEFGKHAGMLPSPAKAIFWFYVGLTFGDLGSGLLSQGFKNRVVIIGVFIVATGSLIGLYFGAAPMTLDHFYGLIFGLGITCGYWALFITSAAENFGTNLRATVTTAIPNLVRAAVIPMTLTFKALRDGGMQIDDAALALGGFTCLLAMLALIPLRETFGKTLDFVEE
jgi:MFS family permease